MTLDAQDRTALMGVRILYGSPKVADLIESMDARYGELPAMKQVNETFTGLAKGDPAKLKALNAVLEKNPALAGKILDNLGRDPEAFRTKFLPAVFANPESAVTLVEQKQQTAAAPAKAAPSREYGYEPIVLAAKTTGVDTAPAAPAQPASATAPSAAKPEAAKAGTAETRLGEKMQLLVATPGYNELMDKVQKNPQLTDAMKAMMASNGSPEEQEEVIDTLLQKTKENPNLFKNLSKKLDENPGAASSIASMIASDPKNALNMMSSVGSDDGPGAGMMGMFSQMFSGGAGGLGGMLSGLFEKLEGMLKSLMGMVTKMFDGGNHLVVGTNDPAQYPGALNAANAKPNSVTYLDASGQTSGAQQVATVTQNQAQEKAKAGVTGPQQPA